MAIGNVPLQHPDPAVSELGRCMDELGMKGVETARSARGRALDQADLDPFWEAVADQGIHPSAPHDPLRGVDLDRYFMSNLGRPAETTVALAGLILSGVFERHPSLRLCAVPGGGFAPFQTGRLDKCATVRPSGHITRAPSEDLRDLFVNTVVHDPIAL